MCGAPGHRRWYQGCLLLRWHTIGVSSRDLRSLSEEFNDKMADERHCHSNSKIDPGKNVSDGPRQALSQPQTRAGKFSHQSDGAKKEDQESSLGHASPATRLHCLTLKTVPCIADLARQIVYQLDRLLKKIR